MNPNQFILVIFHRGLYLFQETGTSGNELACLCIEQRCNPEQTSEQLDDYIVNNDHSAKIEKDDVQFVSNVVSTKSMILLTFTQSINRLIMKLLIASSLLAFAALVVPVGIVNAQSDLEEILKGSQQDANYLASGYITPFLKAFGSGINQGWYNTAKAHKVPGIDFTVSVAMVGIPSEDKSYTIDNSRLNNIYLRTNNTSVTGSLPTTNGSAKVPTVFGSEVEPTYASKDPISDLAAPNSDFSGPAGIEDFDKLMGGRMPVPVFNAGIGLPKGTELKIRWTPEINIGGDGDIKMFGFGVMHDIKQYIPGIKNLPFDLSGLVTYSKIDLGVDFDDAGTQRGEFTVKGTTIQALISKKISVITPYAGLGYGISSASLKAKGHYDFNENQIVDTGETNPVSVDANNSGPRFTAGLRLKLAIFTFHADYTLQKYSAFTGGFGLSIR
jgi:hypothetical protein